MSESTAALAQLILFVAGFLFVVILLDVVWSREQIKKDLRQRGCAPIHVRWCPYPIGYWSRFSHARHAFRVMFVDATGCIQTARCAASSFSRTVDWMSDEARYLNADISRFWRVIHFVAAIVVAGFGLKHLFTGVVAFPGRFSGQFQWQGWPAWLFGLALLCCAGNLLAEALFHRRASERHWTRFARGTALLAWVLFFAAFVVALWQNLPR